MHLYQHDAVVFTFCSILLELPFGLIARLTVENYCLCSVTQMCPTFCDPTDCSPPSSSVHGIFQARVLEWVATSHSRVFSTQGLNLRLLSLLHRQVKFSPLHHVRSPNCYIILNKSWCKNKANATWKINLWKSSSTVFISLFLYVSLQCERE